MSSWKDKDRKHIVRSDAKYNTKTASIVIRLLAAGFTYADAGYAIGVRETTIQSWVQRYPVFKKQIEKVKDVVKAITVAQLLRAAWGYDYDEVKEEFVTVESGEGTEVTPEELKTKKVTVTHKHLPPNGDLIKFLLLNRDKENWRDVKSIDVKATNMTPQLAGQAEAAAIDEIAGSLGCKQIESTDVTKEVDAKSTDPGTISSDSPPDDGGELRVPKNSA